MRFLLFIVTTVLAATAQPYRPFTFSAGVKLGSALNDPESQTGLPTSTYQQSRWTGGPTVEFHLPYRLSLEFDALYRTERSHYTNSFPLGTGANPYTVASVKRANVWDLPLLLKYRFRIGTARPFITAGYVSTNDNSKVTTSYFCSGAAGSCRAADYPFPAPTGGQFTFNRSQGGPTAGGGIEFRTRLITIAPEFRWSRPTNGNPRDDRFTGMVGFTFGKSK